MAAVKRLPVLHHSADYILTSFGSLSCFENRIIPLKPCVCAGGGGGGGLGCMQLFIVKLGFTGVYIIFVISAQKHRLWVLVRTASMRIPTIYVLSRNMKNIRIFYLKNCHFLVVKFSIYLNRRVFVMVC